MAHDQPQAPVTVPPEDGGVGRGTDLLQYLYVALRARKLIFWNFVATCLVAAVVSLLLPPWYAGVALILPPQEQKQGFGLKDILASIPVTTLRLGEKGSPTEIFMGILRSRSVSDTLVSRFRLMEVYDVDLFQDAVEQLRGNVEVEMTREGLIQVTVYDRDRDRAADIANAHVDELDRINKLINWSSAGDRRQFVEKQLDRNTVKLREAQARLQQFQERNKAISLEDQARATISSVAHLYMEVLNLEVKLESFGGSLGSAHPEIVQTKNQLRTKREQLREMIYGDDQKDGADDQFMEQLFMPLVEIPEMAMTSLELEREVSVRGALADLLAQEFMEASIEERNTTSTVQILDRARSPEKKAKPHRTAIVAIAGALSIFASIFGVIVTQYLRDLRSGSSEAGQLLHGIEGELRSLWKRR